MRPWNLIGLVVVQVLVLTGCKGEEEAREYAEGLIEVLKVYQQELETNS